MHKAQVEFIYKTYGGVPGLILTFIQKFERRLNVFKGEPDVLFLRAIHISTAHEEKAIRESAKRQYKCEPKKDGEKAA